MVFFASVKLAVLATYVGDEFLALYHCVRSLAVKEPFPGASNNLLLLFEKVIDSLTDTSLITCSYDCFALHCTCFNYCRTGLLL